MMKRTQAMRKVIALFVGALVCLPSIAEAAKERKSPLTDAPVIRKRLELRDKRFEFGVGAGVTIGQDFYNALLVMPKLSYHFNDWISLAGVGGFNVFPGWKSSFNNDVISALPKDSGTPTIKSPYQAEAAYEMNRIGYLLVGQVEFIPLSGKIALLSSLFSYFDFYVLAGAGVVNLAASGTPAPNAQECPPSGCNGKAFTTTELTINAGVGAHAFLNRWLALNFELHDFIYKNNASGRDVNGDKVVDNRDLQWTNNWVFGMNFQFFLPFKAKISR
jgi:outer membrane beta-barrel protein